MNGLSNSAALTLRIAPAVADARHKAGVKKNIFSLLKR